MKILIIGHELHSHTHSYIFFGIYRALIFLKYNVDWIYKEDDINNIINNNINYDIIITELYYNKNIPIINNCIYIIQQPFLELFNNNSYETDVFMNNLFKNISKKYIILWRPYIKKVSDKIYNNYEENGYRVFVMPWATDLLPYEIDENIKNLESFNVKNISNFIGMPLEHNSILKNSLEKYNIEYKNYGGTFDKNSDRNKSLEENMKLIQESIIAPALQTQWQLDNCYIPCRIFKNISYGKMGVTNNQTVYNLFDKNIIYSDSIDNLVKESLEFNKKEDKNIMIKELMIKVKDNHTYINRINFIFRTLGIL
jgi:hypothetical protein